MIIGHEMLGRVREVGTDVMSVSPGDFAVLTVRRGCGHCAACVIDRAIYAIAVTTRNAGLRDGTATRQSM